LRTVVLLVISKVFVVAAVYFPFRF